MGITAMSRKGLNDISCIILAKGWKGEVDNLRFSMIECGEEEEREIRETGDGGVGYLPQQTLLPSSISRLTVVG